MAGDYILVRCDLPEDPEVIAISSTLGIDEDTVVGKLVRMWRWANMHLENGHARGVTKVWLDRYVNCDGFADTLIDVGWLEDTDDGIQFPKFDQYNSKGGKRRALAAKRQAKRREKMSQHSHAESVTKALPTEQNRTEEKRQYRKGQTEGNSLGGPSAPEPPVSCLTRDALVSVEGIADRICRGIGYHGSDRNFTFQVAALLHAKRLSEHAVADAVQAVRAKTPKPGKPVGYFRKVLKENALKEGIDLDEQLASVSLPRGHPTGPPELSHR